MSEILPRFSQGQNVRYLGTGKVGTLNKVIKSSRSYLFLKSKPEFARYFPDSEKAISTGMITALLHRLEFGENQTSLASAISLAKASGDISRKPEQHRYNMASLIGGCHVIIPL